MFNTQDLRQDLRKRYNTGTPRIVGTLGVTGYTGPTGYTGRLCVKAEIQINEVVTLVRGQLTARPDVHRFNAASVVRETLATEFSCI